MPIVSTLHFFPFMWIQHLLRAIISYAIISSVLKDKYNKITTFFSIIGTGMVYSFIILSFSSKFSDSTEILCALFYYVLQLIVCMIVTSGKIYMKLTAVLFSFLSYLISVATTNTLMLAIDSKFMVSYAYELPLDIYLTEMLGILAVSFIPLLITKKILSKVNKTSFSNKLLLFYTFPLTHILTFYNQSIVNYVTKTNSIDISEQFQKVFIISDIICFVIDFAVLIVVDYMHSIEIRNKELQEQNRINELEYQRILLINKENEGFKKIRHDYLNLLSTTAGYIEIGKTEKALDIINNTSNDVYNPTSVRLCSNDIINTIFSFKNSSAAESGIAINAVVNEHSLVKIDDYNLCRILCNLIDNSINATKDANANSIDIEININENQLKIITKNKFSKKKKQKSKNHGYGIIIIKDILKSQGGTYSQSENGNEFITTTIIENKKN